VERLVAARARFAAGGALDAVVDPVIAASWARCRSVRPGRMAVGGPRHVDDEDLRRRIADSAPLLACARPHLEWLQRSLAYPHVGYLVDRDAVVLVAVGRYEVIPGYVVRPGLDGSEAALGTNAAATAIVAGQPVAVVGPEHYASAWDGTTSLAAPIRDPGGATIGAIALGAAVPDERGALRPLVAHAAFAIEGRIRADAMGQRLRALSEINRTVSASLRLDAVLQAVVDGAGALCRPDGAALFLREADSGALVPRYRAGLRPDAPVPPGRGVAAWVETTGRVFRSGDCPSDPRIGDADRRTLADAAITSLMIVPIRIWERVDGLLAVDRRDGGAFTDDDEAVCVRLASQAAVAIQNARLFEGRLAAEAEARATAERLRRAQRIADSSLLELPYAALLRALPQALHEAMGGDTAAVLLRSGEGDGEALTTQISVGPAGPVEAAVRIPVGSGFAGQIVRRGEPASIEDPTGTELVEPFARDGLKAAIGAPLRIGDRVIGAVYVGTTAGRRFTEPDLRLLSLAASRVALMIDRARLLDAEQRARAAAEAARRRAEAANQAKDEFLSILAHELRGPLAAIVTGVAVLDRMGVRDEETRKVREAIRRQMGHLSRLVDDLLDLSRVARRKFPLKRERIDLRDVVEMAVETERHHVEAEAQALAVAVGDRPLVVEADGERLRQVVANLLSNASKYTARHGRIEVTLTAARGEGVIRVADDGIGIPPEKIGSIFDLFAQAGPAGSRAEAGLGVGLALVKRLVEVHGGTVSAHSDGPGKGSQFVVCLPLATSRPGDVQPSAARPVE
jgi:signal transduction histidine kinase